MWKSLYSLICLYVHVHVCCVCVLLLFPGPGNCCVLNLVGFGQSMNSSKCILWIEYVWVMLPGHARISCSLLILYIAISIMKLNSVHHNLISLCWFSAVEQSSIIIT